MAEQKEFLEDWLKKEKRVRLGYGFLALIYTAATSHFAYDAINQISRGDSSWVMIDLALAGGLGYLGYRRIKGLFESNRMVTNLKKTLEDIAE